MKKYILYLSAGVVCVMFASCTATGRLQKKGALDITPEKQNLVVNQFTNPYTVNVGYTVDVPRKYVPRKAQVIHESWLVNGDNHQSVAKIYLNGRTYERMMWRSAKFEKNAPDYSDGVMIVSGRDPKSVSVNTNVVFQEWMTGADLVAHTEVKVCKGAFPLWHQTLAKGVEFIPLDPGPVIIEPEPVVIPEPVIIKDEGFAKLTYAVNVYRVNPDYGNNAAELKKMIDLLDHILGDSLYRTTQIVITGVCSPDGSFTYNSELARNRADAVRTYLIEHVGINPELIRTEFISEDWDGLRNLVEKSDITGKAAILNIIDGTLGPDAKDAALQRLPQYNILKTKMYPELRQVRYAIYYTKKELPK